MTRLRIVSDGTVRGLWNDDIDWRHLGHVSVRRASHVEFCDRRQQWYVQVSRPRSISRRFLQWAIGRPFGEILHWAATRRAALAWEKKHFGPGGLGWKAGE